MNRVVIKRDGLEKNFDIACIEEAIKKAAIAANKEISDFDEIISKIANKLNKEKMTVEEIQEVIEHTLMVSKYKDVAKKFIEYRKSRDIAREQKSRLFKAVEGIVSQKDKTLLYENANVDSKTLTSQRTLIAGELSKDIARSIIPKHIYEAHVSGDIHWHDLTFSPALPYVNCCLVDYRNMLKNGFTLGGANIQSPKSIGVATAVVAQIIAQVSSQNYGGTSIANIDQGLAPYVKMSYDKHIKNAKKFGITDIEGYAKTLTEKETYDAFQALEYEINSLFNSHAQSPFTTVSFGMGTSWEERLIQQCILKVRLEGLGEKKITAVFPKLIFFIGKGLNRNKEDVNYDIKRLALECASKRLYPDLISVENIKKITGSSTPVTSMGCRSFLSVWKDEEENEVLDSRNNLGVVSINIPRIALESESLEEFWKLLDKRCELAHEAIKVRIESLKDLTSDYAPTLYQQGAFGIRAKRGEKVFDKFFANSRASVSLGYIGIHETVCHLMKIDKLLHNKDAYDLAVGIVKFLKDKTEQWKILENMGYSLYSTPSEGLCDRLLRLDRQKFGVVKNVTDKDFYTNSYHLDVRENATPFEKIDFEAPFHYIATGGFISYVEFDTNIQKNLDGLEAVWDYAMDKMGYFGTNTQSNKCYDCGNDGEFVTEGELFKCPVCGNKDQSKMNVILRICGYAFSATDRKANHGKFEEIKSRVKHCK